MTFAELTEKLSRGEQWEADARKRDEEGFRPMWCTHGWARDSRECEAERASGCDEGVESYCALSFREWEDQRDALYKTAITLYREAAEGLRALARQEDSEEAWLALAEALMDIDVHPDSMDIPPADLYWEAQYCYLRLYYATGRAPYMEQARMCEAFRHATVRLAEEEDA